MEKSIGTSNRTKVELKPPTANATQSLVATSNRTKAELKRRIEMIW